MNASFDLGDIATWAGTIVAVIALLRPELGALFTRVTNKLEFYPLDFVEVGFSNFGPTIGIAGTVEALPNSELISLSKTVVARTENPAHELRWLAFKPLSVALQPDLKDVQAAAPFRLPGQQARQMSILHCDRGFLKDISNDLLLLRNRWNDFLARDLPSIPPAQAQNPFEVFRRFSERPDNVAIHDKLKSKFIWESGAYSLELIFECTKPRREFRYAF